MIAISSRRKWIVPVAKFWLISFRDKRRLFLSKEWLLVLSGSSLVVSIAIVPASPLGWALRGVSILGLIIGVVRIKRSRDSYDFPPRSAAGVVGALTPEVRAEVMQVEGEVFLPLALPEALSNKTPVTSAPEYKLPATLKELSHPFILGNRDRSSIVDRPGLGLADVGDDVFEVRTMSYFQYLTSNFAYQYFARPHGNPNLDAFAGYLVKSNGSLVDFGDSHFPNLIGISTLATTREGRVFVVQSSRRNTGQPGYIHPSASGSVEPKDWQAGGSAEELVVTAMNRELCEESSIRPEEIISTSVLGMARWLNKGGMPEFFGVTQTSVRADDLARRKPSGEDPLFVKRVIVTDLRLSDIHLAVHNNALDLSGLPAFIAGSCSGPLGMCMWLATTVEAS